MCYIYWMTSSKKSPLSLVCLISKSNEFLKLKQEERIKLSSVNKWSWQISESVFVRQHWTRDWFSVEALQFLCEIVYTNLQARAKCDESGQTDRRDIFQICVCPEHVCICWGRGWPQYPLKPKPGILRLSWHHQGKSPGKQNTTSLHTILTQMPNTHSLQLNKRSFADYWLDVAGKKVGNFTVQV